VASLYPRNTLTVEFSFESVRLQDDTSTVPDAAILRSSELMVKGLPHFAAMPRLDMLANTGFPYTRHADLAETLVLLPAEPTSDEVSLFLTMAGFMGAQTGLPGVAHRSDSANRGAGRNRQRHPDDRRARPAAAVSHVGATHDRPAVRQSVRLGADLRLEGVAFVPARHRRSDGPEESGTDPGNDQQIEGVVQGFASPLYLGRTVVAFTSMPGKSLASLAEDWASVANASRLYGSVSLFSGNQFHSFTLDANKYHVGSLAKWPAMQYWGRRYYWLSPILIFACMWLLHCVLR
jgi:cellulose synthase (UDP-forming)